MSRRQVNAENVHDNPYLFLSSVGVLMAGGGGAVGYRYWDPPSCCILISHLYGRRRRRGSAAMYLVADAANESIRRLLATGAAVWFSLNSAETVSS